MRLSMDMLGARNSLASCDCLQQCTAPALAHAACCVQERICMLHTPPVRSSMPWHPLKMQLLLRRPPSQHTQPSPTHSPQFHRSLHRGPPAHAHAPHLAHRPGWPSLLVHMCGGRQKKGATIMSHERHHAGRQAGKAGCCFAHATASLPYSSSSHYTISS